eukprot:COSAG01_NODE_19053_length_1034_cov_0.674866_2_plen_69_part_01
MMCHVPCAAVLFLTTDFRLLAPPPMPQQEADHYAVLGVAPSASPQALRPAYREQAKVQHPDKGGSATEF